MRASTYAFIAAALFGVFLVLRKIQQWTCAFSSDWTLSADGVSDSMYCAAQLGLAGLSLGADGGVGVGSMEEGEAARAAALPGLIAEREAAQEAYASDVSAQTKPSGYKFPGSAISGGDGDSWLCLTPCWYKMTDQEKHWYCNDCDTSRAGWWLYCYDVTEQQVAYGVGKPWADTERCP